MQQHDFNLVTPREEQRLNMLEREKLVPRYKFPSPLYYKKKHEDDELKEIT
jgi:hypothetical protein